MLLNTILLDVLHFIDYNSRLRAKFACSNFLRLIVRNQEILAPSQKLCLAVNSAGIRIEGMPGQTPLGSFDLSLSVVIVATGFSYKAPRGPHQTVPRIEIGHSGEDI